MYSGTIQKLQRDQINVDDETTYIQQCWLLPVNPCSLNPAISSTMTTQKSCRMWPHQGISQFHAMHILEERRLVTSPASLLQAHLQDNEWCQWLARVVPVTGPVVEKPYLLWLSASLSTRVQPWNMKMPEAHRTSSNAIIFIPSVLFISRSISRAIHDLMCW